jgi:anaerobic dimethyl sulfoxide reductase subunit B (iron-sulfur subunit)
MPNIINIVTYEYGEFPQVSLAHFFLTCFHCAEPSCIPVCPNNIIAKRKEDGIVVLKDPQSCTQCGFCIEACPYQAPKIINGNKLKIIKCDMCIDRLAEEKGPACVVTCPTEALDVGLFCDIFAKYGEESQVIDFIDLERTKPSIIFRGKEL